MDRYQALFKAQFETVARKKAAVAQKTREKKEYLDPTWYFNVNDSQIIDADTLDNSAKERLRFKGWDSYETQAKPYLDNPNKLRTHQESYAAAYGLDPADVSINDLLEAGKAQKQAFQQKLQEAADPQGNIAYKRRGLGERGRVLAELTSEGKQAAFLQDVTSRFEDAGYSGKFNVLRELKDWESGDTLNHLQGGGERSWGQAAGDSLANFIRGGLEMVNDTAQAASVLTGVSQVEGVDKFFANNRERLEAFKQYWNSPQQLRRERLAQEKRTRISEPLFEARAQEYLAQGDGETEARFKAGLDEAGDTLVDLMEQPGRILDGFFESLPYMLGVAGVGKAVMGKSVRNLEKKLTAELSKAGAKDAKDLASQSAQRYLATKEGTQYMKRLSEWTGVGTVALTEGLSNSASIYDSVLAMTEEEGQGSDTYKQLRKTMDHDAATKKLAQNAFLESFGLMTFIAGAASKVTGAAAFESRLFSRLADGQKAASKILSAKGIKQKAIEAGKGAEKILTPGVRETVEESIQSGSGEFLAQLAEFETTGEPVGSGVGAATAEGGVLGFVSGAGVSGVSVGGKAALKGAGKGIKKIVDTRNKDLNEVEGSDAGILVQPSETAPAAPEGEQAPEATPQPYDDKNPREEGIQPGSSPILAHREVEELKKAGNYQPKEVYQETVAALKEETKESGLKFEGLFRHFTRLEAHHNEMLHQGESLEEKDQQYFDDLKLAFKGRLNKEAKFILENKSKTDYTPLEKAIVNEAAARDLGITAYEQDELTDTASKVLYNASKVNETLANLSSLSARITVAETDNIEDRDPSEAREYDNELQRVNAEKLEDLVSVIEPKEEGGFAKTVLGLKAHRREMEELIARGDESSAQAFRLRQGMITNFVNTQKKQLEGIHELYTAFHDPSVSAQEVAAIEKRTGYKAKPGLENLYEMKREELQEYQRFQSDMAGEWQAWNGRTDSAINKIASQEIEKPGQELPDIRQPIAQAEEDDLQRRYDEVKATVDLGYQPIPQKPPDLLERIANSEHRLDRTKFKGDLAENQKNIRVGNKWLFESDKLAADGKGMGPEELLTFMRENKFMLEGDTRQPDQLTADDAVNMLNAALRDEQVRSLEDDEAWDKHDNAVRYNNEIAQAETELGFLQEELDKRAAEQPTSKPDVAQATEAQPEVAAATEGIQQELKLETKATEEPTETGRTTEEPASKEELKSFKTEVEDVIGVVKLQEMYDKELLSGGSRAKADIIQTEIDYRIKTAKAEIAPEPSVQTTAEGKVNVWASSNENKNLSNLAPRPFTYEGRQYKSVEHAYQTNKSGSFDEETDRKYRESGDYQKIQGQLLANQKESNNLMTRLIETSFAQNPQAQRELLATGTAELTHTQDKKHWGTKFPEILSTVRSKLQNKEVLEDSGALPTTKVTPQTTYREMVNLRDGTNIERDEAALNLPTVDPGTVHKRIRAQLSEYTPAQLRHWIDNIQIPRLRQYTPPTTITASRVDLRPVMQAEIREAEKMLAEFPESAQEPAVTQPKPKADIERGLNEGDVYSVFDAGNPKAGPRARGTPPTVEKNGVELEDSGELGTRIRAIQDLKQAIPQEGPVELPTEDNDRFQELIAGGFTPEQALNQIENNLTDTVADEKLTVKVEPRFAPILRQAKKAINNVNQETTTEANTQELLDQQLDIEQIGEFLKLAVEDSSSIPWEAPMEERFPKIKAWLEKNKIPLAANKILKVRNPKSRNVLNSAPAVVYAMNEDPEVKAQMYDKLDLNDTQRAGFDIYLRFYSAFKDKLNEIRTGFDKNDRNSILASSGVYANERLQDHLVTWLQNNEGNFPDSIVAGMALELMNWLATSGPATTFNEDAAVRSLLGYTPGAQVDPTVLDKFRYMGTSRLETAQRWGDAAWKQTNLAVQNNPKVDNLFEQRMKASLGSVMMGVAREMGLIELPSMPMSEFQTYRNTDAQDSQDTGEKTMNFVRNAPLSQDEEGLGRNSKANEILKEAHETVRQVFGKYFGSQPFAQGPVFEPPTEVKVRGGMNLPKAQKKNILRMSQEPIRLSKNMFEGVIDRMGGLLNYLKHIEGRHDDDAIDQRTHVKNQKGKRAANLGDLRNLEAVTNHYQKHQNGIFYLPYVVINTGRINVDSNTVNYQNNSLQRFLMEMPEWENEITGTDSEQYGLFMTAVGLGFGFDPSQYRREKIIDMVQNKVNDTESLKQAIEILQEDSTKDFTPTQMETLGKAVAEMGEGTHSLVALKEYAGFLKAMSKGEAFTSYLPTEVDGKTNGLTSLLMQFVPSNRAEWEQHKLQLNAGSVFFENDGYENTREFKEQNGLDNYQQLATLTGSNLYKMQNGEELEVTNPRRHPKISNERQRREHIRKNGVAQVVASNLLPSIRTLQLRDTEQGKNQGKAGRKWAKGPTTQVAYSASIGSIKRGMVVEALDAYYEDLAQIGWEQNEKGKWVKRKWSQQEHAEAIATQVQKIYNIVNVVREANEVSGHKIIPPGTEDLSQLNADHLERSDTTQLHITASQILSTAKKDYSNSLYELQTNRVLPEAIVADLAVGLEETYGHATEAALDKLLGPIKKIQDTLNQMTQYMNIVFTKDFARRLKWFEKSKGVVASDTQRQDILNQMIREGRVPMIKTALSTDVLEQLNISKTGRITLKKEEGQKNAPRGIGYFNQEIDVRVDEKGKRKGQRSIVTSLKGIVPERNIGVRAIVNAIHNSDGAVNSQIFGEFPGFNIHDAFITGIQHTLAAAKFGNQTFGNVHSTYSIAEAVWDAFVQTQVIVGGADTRLSTKDRQEIQQEFYKAMQRHARWDKDLSSAQVKGAIDNWIKRAQKTVKDNTEARQELFQQIRSIDQFGIDGGTQAFPKGLLADTVTPKNLAVEVTGQQDLLNKLHEPAAQRGLISTVLGAFRENRDPSPQILDVIKATGTPQDAGEVFTALAAAYEMVQSPIAQTLREVANIIGKNIPGLKIQVRRLDINPDTGKPYASAQYDTYNSRLGNKEFPGGLITLNQNSENRNVMQDILHEVLHGMNYNKLRRMEIKQPEQFRELFNQTLEFLRRLKREGKLTNRKDKKNAPYREIWRQIVFHRKNRDPAGMISEYISYALSQPKALGAHYEQLFSEKEITAAIQTLNSALADDRGKTPYRSSIGRLDKSTFREETAEKLESDKLQMIFAEMDRLHGAPTNAAENAFLDEQIETLLVPGIRSIEATNINRATIAGAKSHEGEFVEPYINGKDELVPGTIYVAAAGNPTTSMNPMSAKEVTAHEIFHAITYAALNSVLKGSAELAYEAERLFDIAKKAIKPKDFLEDPDTATPHDWVAAQNRWDHIFNNPDGQGYHEFVAMARSNYQLATALSKIDNRRAKEPIWTGQFMTDLKNLVNRIIDWLALHTIRRNTPNVDMAVTSLVEKIIQINNQNIAAVDQMREGSFTNKWNDKVVRAFAEKLLKRLENVDRQEFLASDESRDASVPTRAIRAAERVVRSTSNANTAEFRKALNEVFRNMGEDNSIFRKNNAWFQLLEEVLPYQQANLKFYDLLRKSKVAIDMKRQRFTEHGRSYLLRIFDPDYFRTHAQRDGVSQALLMTDLAAVTQGNNSLTYKQAIDLVRYRNRAESYLSALILDLRTQLQEQLPAPLVSDLMKKFVGVQGKGLSRVMVEGIAPAKHQMLNAHNIVNQFYLQGDYVKNRVELQNKDALIDTLDKIISTQALLGTNRTMISNALTVIDHELQRNPGNQENAIEAFLGLAQDFKKQSKLISFANNPVQMRKGHIAEIYDENIELKAVPATPIWEKEMKAKGYKPHHILGRDHNDPNQKKMQLWSRRSTVTAYQKSIMSLRDLHHQGTDMFTSLEQGKANPNSDGRISAYQAHVNFEAAKKDIGYLASKELELPRDPTTNMVPILDDQGVIRGYRYMMTEEHRRTILKKRTYFDEVLPRMFGAMLDKTNSKNINDELVKALHADWLEYGEYTNHPGDPEHRFVEIGKHSKNAKAREMWQLLPQDTKDAFRKAFKGDEFYLRDDVVNLVMGFRKLTVANKEFLGKAAPAVRLGEQIFQELLQWKRLKVAILNPVVVVGNIISNVMILLGEGIPPSYIKKMGVEALRGIRKYQRDIRRADELEYEVHALRQAGRDVTARANELAQLQENIRNNPVGELIDEGLFTSIVEEFGLDEDSWRKQQVAKLGEHLGEKTPTKLMNAGKEIWMLPGSQTFKAALVGTQYGDFVGRYIKFRYDTEEINQGMDPDERRAQAINDTLAAFIYYDLPQNEYLQYANDMGFVMFTKFFLRIQPVIARMFLKNPITASVYTGLQTNLLDAPWDENIANFGALSGIENKGTLNPVKHIWNTDYVMPATMEWFKFFGIGN